VNEYILYIFRFYYHLNLRRCIMVLPFVFIYWKQIFYLIFTHFNCVHHFFIFGISYFDIIIIINIDMIYWLILFHYRILIKDISGFLHQYCLNKIIHNLIVLKASLNSTKQNYWNCAFNFGVWIWKNCI